jgi:hypothetical protein
LAGEQPTIYAIRNPSKRLDPAPPEKVEIPRWDANAAIRYEFRRKQSREALERTTAQTEPPDAVSLDGVNTERYD